MTTINELVQKLENGMTKDELIEEGNTKMLVGRAFKRWQNKSPVTEFGGLEKEAPAPTPDLEEKPEPAAHEPVPTPDQEEKPEPAAHEPASEKEQPKNILGGINKYFRDLNSGDSNNDNIEKENISLSYEDEPNETDTKSGTDIHLTSDFKISDGIYNIFTLIAQIRKKEYWNLDKDEIKTVKKICPSLSKYDKLAKVFSQYSCVISLAVIILKRVQHEIKDKKETEYTEVVETQQEELIIPSNRSI